MLQLIDPRWSIGGARRTFCSFSNNYRRWAGRR
ncbi:MAG: hypothetical protein ACI82I_003195, partial [Gammaproteobacteria bacterium]